MGHMFLQNLGNVCLGILDGSEIGLEELNLIGGRNLCSTVTISFLLVPHLCSTLFYCLCRHIHARQSYGIRKREEVNWLGTCRLQPSSKIQRCQYLII